MDITNINLGNLGRYLDAYEHGKLTSDEAVDLFQVLLDTGMLDHLRTEFSVVADIMIKDNLICGDLNQLRQEYAAAAYAMDRSLTDQRRGDK
jgi:hypothetical protein